MNNNLKVDDLVYFIPSKQYGKVERVNALGLPTSVIVLLDNGERHLCVDNDIKNICKYFPLFVQTLQESGSSVEDFSLAWLDVSLEKRQELYNELVAIREKPKSVKMFLSKTLLKLNSQ